MTGTSPSSSRSASPGAPTMARRWAWEAYSFERTIAHGDEIYERIAAQAAGDAPLDEAVFRRAPGEHEQLLDILHSIAGDKRKTYSANLPNRGAVRLTAGRYPGADRGGDRPWLASPARP